MNFIKHKLTKYAHNGGMRELLNWATILTIISWFVMAGRFYQRVIATENQSNACAEEIQVIKKDNNDRLTAVEVKVDILLRMAEREWGKDKK